MAHHTPVSDAGAVPPQHHPLSLTREEGGEPLQGTSPYPNLALAFAVIFVNVSVTRWHHTVVGVNSLHPLIKHIY